MNIDKRKRSQNLFKQSRERRGDHFHFPAVVPHLAKTAMRC